MNNNTEIFDLIIIGAGPAGITAGVYSARKKLKTLVLTKDFGGQSIVTNFIENWTGEIKISGMELAKKLKNHIKHYEADDFVIKEFTFVEKIEETGQAVNGKKVFSVTDNKGEIYLTKSILNTSGAKRRKLLTKGADEFEHKGLTYCASCDGPFFTEKDVVVIGGGNSGFESASQLMAYAKSVTILHRSKKFNAEPVMVNNILSNPKITGILNANIIEIFGSDFVEGIKYTDENNEEKTLNVEGVFIEIGAIPATDFISSELIEKDEFKQIKIDHRTGRTSKNGIWAAGDCTDSLFKQNSIAMGDATKAIEDLYNYLQN
ncbi:MAG: FAD-dependent oxidoreductase [Candidatus Pacebacteria bacterium]|nr:FAD-dependent oxidoreductase [Candidatus Paceibacterota bacterium]